MHCHAWKYFFPSSSCSKFAGCLGNWEGMKKGCFFKPFFLFPFLLCNVFLFCVAKELLHGSGCRDPAASRSSLGQLQQSSHGSHTQEHVCWLMCNYLCSAVVLSEAWLFLFPRTSFGCFFFFFFLWNVGPVGSLHPPFCCRRCNGAQSLSQTWQVLS